ncbi:MAG: hypothetical protein QHC89_02610 [Bosea sp. (in: a-proteobacteria)]|nr:hypothetical protein [Bosea sp. (in: a-proteobacteria)]
MKATMTRADLCTLFGWTVHTFKGLERHQQLPLDTNDETTGWRRFSAFDAVKIEISQHLEDSVHLSRVAAAQIVNAASAELRERWKDIVETGEDLNAGRATDEFMVGRANLAFPNQPAPLCYRRSEEGVATAHITAPIVSSVTANASRAVSVVMTKAIRAGIDLDWED